MDPTRADVPIVAPPPFPESHRVTYLCLTCGKLRHPTESAAKDAAQLVEQCLKPLGRYRRFPRRYPPQLFILWVTPAFFPRLDPLLGELHTELKSYKCGKVPLL